MTKTLSSFTLPWTLWKRTGCFRHFSFSKGTILSSGDIIKMSTNNEDEICNSLKVATSSSKILNIIGENHKTMNSKHVLQALKSIFYLEKNERTNFSSMKSLLNNPNFEKLCRNLKSQAGVLDLNDVVESLKILTFIKVPTNSTISQILLQLIRHNVNSLNIYQLLFLDFLLKSFEPTPLVEALNIALPLVFEIQIPIKMDKQNPAHMAACLFYALRRRLNDKTINLIVRSLEEYEGEFDMPTAKSIILSLCAMRRNYDIEALYRKSVTDLILNFDGISTEDVGMVLHRMAQKYCRLYSFYYQEVFFDTCANYCVENKIDMKMTADILRHSSRVHHFNKNLLDYASSLVHNDPSLICTPSRCYSIVISLILSDYKPIYWDSLSNWIKNARDLGLVDKREIIWIRFAAALCLLEIYKADVLSRALNRSYLEAIFRKGFISDFENYFIIWKCITRDKPELSDLLPSNFEPKTLVDRIIITNDFPLQAALERGLGNKKYLLTNLYSKYGDIIDHAIVFDDNGDPIILDQDVKFIEDLSINDNSQLVLILGLQDFNYTVNTKTQRANVTKSIEILEGITKNCHVIPVNLECWLELNEFEKIPYLIQKIKEKIDLDINMSEIVI
ncbi:uncharacterized protein LOC115887274 [Sitophilus oryzae]|uniref:Uncharacterized protein LOC115887274 n=1 Tax=Sitophilus oryzae TaxID=7048 RepID=A0A6J2YHC8_SITOR|nr:uncharacterized protein LOC115887274 [Sitophilus oryzae]